LFIPLTGVATDDQATMANTLTPDECYKFKHFVVETTDTGDDGFILKSLDGSELEMSSSQIVEFANQLISLYAEFIPDNPDDHVITWSRQLLDRYEPTYLMATKMGEKTKIRLLEFKASQYLEFQIDLEDDDVHLFAAFLLRVINYTDESQIRLAICN